MGRTFPTDQTPIPASIGQPCKTTRSVGRASDRNSVTRRNPPPDASGNNPSPGHSGSGPIHPTPTPEPPLRAPPPDRSTATIPSPASDGVRRPSSGNTLQPPQPILPAIPDSSFGDTPPAASPSETAAATGSSNTCDSHSESCRIAGSRKEDCQSCPGPARFRHPSAALVG